MPPESPDPSAAFIKGFAQELHGFRGRRLGAEENTAEFGFGILAGSCYCFFPCSLPVVTIEKHLGDLILASRGQQPERA